MITCLCCDGACTRWGRKRCHGSDWRIDRCQRCGFGFVFPRPDWQTIHRFYLEQGGHGDKETTTHTAEAILDAEAGSPGSSLDAARIAGRLRTLCGRTPEGVVGRPTLLDVGCGYGFFSRAARDRGFRVTAIELSDHEAEVARSIASIEPIRTSFEDFQPSSTFDAIIMSQVLEHTIDPLHWIRKARSILRPGGWLCVAVPNFGGIFQRVLGIRDFMIIPPAHLNYFTPRALVCLLERGGLSSGRIDHVTRIPRRSIARRLGRFGSLATSAGQTLADVFSRSADLMAIGGIINVYATLDSADSSHAE